MDDFFIDGGTALRGTAVVNGSKNAALPILIATLLTDEPCVISNVPRLRDIRTTFRLLETLGKKVSVSGHTVRISAAGALKTRAPYDIVKQMRASVLVAGPLLARFGRVRVALPGGCAIGLRPIDIHLQGLRAMGARESAEGGDVVLCARPLPLSTGRDRARGCSPDARPLRPAKVRLRFASVGATENLMMAAAATPGVTTIDNAAREPEIADLGVFLRSLGARVSGAGTARVRVAGVPRLRGARHRVIPDRIETGTLLIAAAAAGGRVFLQGADAGQLTAVLAALRAAGARVRASAAGIRISAHGRPRAVSIRTGPHPGFPTDLQAPWMAYMTRCLGACRIREDIFERRFIHAAELGRMGARIAVRDRTAAVTGVPALEGAGVMSSDIRAGAALVVAGLAARGRTYVQRVYHIDRGYERLERTLRRLGARIRRVRAP